MQKHELSTLKKQEMMIESCVEKLINYSCAFQKRNVRLLRNLLDKEEGKNLFTCFHFGDALNSNRVTESSIFSTTRFIDLVFIIIFNSDHRSSSEYSTRFLKTFSSLWITRNRLVLLKNLSTRLCIDENSR